MKIKVVPSTCYIDKQQQKCIKLTIKLCDDMIKTKSYGHIAVFPLTFGLGLFLTMNLMVSSAELAHDI